MQLCLFLSFRLRLGSSLSLAETARLDQLAGAIPGLSRALVHTPARASAPYLDDGPAPSLVLQLYFSELTDLESALGGTGQLSLLLSRGEFKALGEADITQQAMLARPFAVPEPAFAKPPEEPCCTYLVAYEGEAKDLNAWLGNYLGSHIGHMTQLPGLRELEVYTRLDWISSLPFRRVNFFQRNKVAFDSEAALTSALHSPVRQKMREDYRAFPPFTSGNTHYAMMTRVVRSSH